MAKMTSGMRMMAMARASKGERREFEHGRMQDGGGMSMMDEPEMRRRRDSRGRYMEGEGGSRMEHDGNQETYGRMDGDTEMRRRRDSRGRYMEGGEDGASAHYSPWPEPHMPPYLDKPGMADDRSSQPEREMRYMADDGRQPMRDRNIVNIHDYQDKRRIGFGADMHHGAGQDARKVEAGGTFWMSPQGGHDKLTKEKAEKWVRSMHGDDPKARGEMWTYDDAKKLAEERGLPAEGQSMVDYYVALNMVYNDYCKVAKAHGVDTEDYYADLAQAWLYDRDGLPPAEKLMAYYKYVIPHEEE